MVERKHKFETEKSVEDYLKTIYILSGKKDVHGVDTFCWLLTGLGVDEKAAASDACEMEHAVSAESYQALERLWQKEMEEHKDGYVTECDWRSCNGSFGACFLLRRKGGLSENAEAESGQ